MVGGSSSNQGDEDSALSSDLIAREGQEQHIAPDVSHMPQFVVC
jgi:hypothetical protein